VADDADERTGSRRERERRAGWGRLMHRKSCSLVAQPKLRAYFEIGALAEQAGMRRHLMLRLLRRTKVRFVRLCRVSLVPLTELGDRLPTLCRYLHAIDEGRRVAQR